MLSTKTDNFIDKAYCHRRIYCQDYAHCRKRKKAYSLQRWFAAQNNGDYSEALEYYKESLKLRKIKLIGEKLKNGNNIHGMGKDLSIKLKKALIENPKQPSCLKNIGNLWKGYMLNKIDLDQRDIWFDKAAECGLKQ